MHETDLILKNFTQKKIQLKKNKLYSTFSNISQFYVKPCHGPVFSTK